VVTMLASGTRVRGFKPGRSRQIFFGRKNPQHALPNVADLRHVIEPCDYKEVVSQAKFAGHFSPESSTFRY
jgi:hypothetical protein